MDKIIKKIRKLKDQLDSIEEKELRLIKEI